MIESMAKENQKNCPTPDAVHTQSLNFMIKSANDHRDVST